MGQQIVDVRIYRKLPSISLKTTSTRHLSTMVRDMLFSTKADEQFSGLETLQTIFCYRRLLAQARTRSRHGCRHCLSTMCGTVNGKSRPTTFNRHYLQTYHRSSSLAHHPPKVHASLIYSKRPHRTDCRVNHTTVPSENRSAIADDAVP